MNKKRRNLLLLLLATVVCGGLLWLLSRGGEDEAGHSHTHEVSDGDTLSHQSGVLIDEPQENLERLVFRNADARYTAYIDENKGKVAFQELEGYPVNESFMEYVWYSVVQLTYQDIITTTNAEDYNAKAFGLDTPSLTVNASFRDGKTYTFRAGANVPGYEEDVYYVTCSGDSHVYACTLDTSFFMGNSYYLSDDIFFDYDSALDDKKDITIGNMTLSGDQFDGSFVMKVNQTSDMSDPLYGFDYVVTSPIHWPVRSSSASKLVYDLTYMMADDVEMLNPTKKQLAAYGLSHPYVTVNFVRNGKNCVLYGSKPDRDNMYVMLKGGKIVYRLNTDSLSILSQLSPDILYHGSAISVSLESISGITVQNGSDKTTLTVSRVKNENVMTESDLIYTYHVKANGTEIKYALYTNFVKQLGNAAVRQWNVKKPAGKAAVTVTVSYFDSFAREPSVIRFYPYSEREYAVEWGDGPVNTVAATWVKQFLEDAGQL